MRIQADTLRAMPACGRNLVGSYWRQELQTTRKQPASRAPGRAETWKELLKLFLNPEINIYAYIYIYACVCVCLLHSLIKKKKGHVPALHISRNKAFYNWTARKQ